MYSFIIILVHTCIYVITVFSLSILLLLYILTYFVYPPPPHLSFLFIPVLLCATYSVVYPGFHVCHIWCHLSRFYCIPHTVSFIHFPVHHTQCHLFQFSCTQQRVSFLQKDVHMCLCLFPCRICIYPLTHFIVNQCDTITHF